MKRTLKRELKVLEIAEREANGTSRVSKIGVRRVDLALRQRKHRSVF